MTIINIGYEYHREALAVSRSGITLRIAFTGADQRDRVIINACEEGERRLVTPETREHWNTVVRNTGHVDVIYRSRAGRKPNPLTAKIKAMNVGQSLVIDEPITATIRSTITNVSAAYIPRRLYRLKASTLTRLK